MKKIIIYEEKEDLLKNQPNSPIDKFLNATKTTGQYRIIFEALKKSFKPDLVFSKDIHSTASFKDNLAGKANLFIRIELGDGKVIGCFFKKPYSKRFNTEMFAVDPDAFVYWLDAWKIYKAARNSVSQYDVSPDYLFSVGNTYKWDGFWFLKDFTHINPDHNRFQIKSQQYIDLSIPIPDKKVKRF